MTIMTRFGLTPIWLTWKTKVSFILWFPARNTHSTNVVGSYDEYTSWEVWPNVSRLCTLNINENWTLAFFVQEQKWSKLSLHGFCHNVPETCWHDTQLEKLAYLFPIFITAVFRSLGQKAKVTKVTLRCDIPLQCIVWLAKPHRRWPEVFWSL